MAQSDSTAAVSATELLTVEDLCFLANTFTEKGDYDKAILIYEKSVRLFPENLALKINLGRLRSERQKAIESPNDIIAKPSLEFLRKRDDIAANRFQGLGEIFLHSGRRDDAATIFQMSKMSNPSFYLPYLNLGRLYLESGETAKAIEELETARRLNPFHEELCDLLRAARFQNRDYLEALDHAIDGLVLSGEATHIHTSGPYRAKIKAIMEKVPNFTGRMRNERIRQRRNRIQALYEELEEELQRAQKAAIPMTSSTAAAEPSPLPFMKTEERDLEKQALDVAVQLRRHLIFRNMEDEAVLKVARFTSEVTHLQGEYAYREGDPVYGLYLINRGHIEIQKNTPFGPITYSSFEKGSFFGDDNLLSGRERFTGALATEDTDLLFIDKAGLANIFVREKPIAIHFLWYFWKSLSLQIREANERMKDFFAGTDDAKRRDLRTVGGGRITHVEIDKKLEVLQSKGLAAKELGLLARFSNEEIYNKGETIFREGDPGDRLYIVLEGSVLISKRISGAGEEALAVLKRGDFFGEMALVGQHERSADAKAEEQNTTVLVITREALREILSIDTDSAYQFLTILCRILSQRLLEINEKIYQWRLMSGDFK